MDVVMKYAVVEIDWDDCWYDLIALFDDVYEAQDVVLSLFQEKEFEDFCDFLFFDGWCCEGMGEVTLEECYEGYKEWRYPYCPGDFCFEVKEVPYFGR